MLTYRQRVETTTLKCKKGLSVLKAMAAKSVGLCRFFLLYQSVVCMVLTIWPHSDGTDKSTRYGQSAERKFQRHPHTRMGRTQKQILYIDAGERGGEWGKQVGSMNEESQVRGCYNITIIYANQETVSVLKKTQANKTFRT